MQERAYFTLLGLTLLYTGQSNISYYTPYTLPGRVYGYLYISAVIVGHYKICPQSPTRHFVAFCSRFVAATRHFSIGGRARAYILISLLYSEQPINSNSAKKKGFKKCCLRLYCRCSVRESARSPPTIHYSYS